jgi:Tol biopolymer transport system component
VPTASIIVVWLSTAALLGAAPHPVSVDDLMRLRTISDVRISPDGQRVAYVVSQPNLEKSVHDAVLYTVPTVGGAPLRMTYGTRILNQPVPKPQLRWSPDGRSLGFIAMIDDVPQVVVMSAAGGEPRAVTSTKEGTAVFEWSPDGKRIAYLAPDPPSDDEQKRKKEKSYVIEVDRNERPPRLWVQDVGGGKAVALTPTNQYVAGLTWSPDAKTIAYAASPMGGFNSQFNTRIYAVLAAINEPYDKTAPRAIVDRPGMNTSPQYSPDGRWIGFVSSDGTPEMMSTWGLHVVPTAGGGGGRNLSQETGNWVGEFAWAADSHSIFVVPNEGTAQRGAGMFEQPVFRAWIDTGKTDRITTGPTVNYSPTVSRDGKRLTVGE